MAESSGCERPDLVLCCPKDLRTLTLCSEGTLSCEFGHLYPVIEGVPVLLRDDVEQTTDIARASHSAGKE